MESCPRHSRYEIKRKIGEGTYGLVYDGVDKVTGQRVAIKDIILEDDGTGIPSTAIREIALLKKLRHENIVELTDVIHFSKRLVMVFEYLEYDLRQYMKMRKQSLSLVEIKVTAINSEYSVPNVKGSRLLPLQERIAPRPEASEHLARPPRAGEAGRLWVVSIRYLPDERIHP